MSAEFPQPDTVDVAANQKGKGASLLSYWKEEIRLGLRYRLMYGQSKAWERYKNMYRGFWPRGVVPVNLMYSLARTLIPQIYFRNPQIHIKAKKPGFGPHAAVLERIDNHMVNACGMKNEIKSMVLDTFMCGRGPGIIGYDSEWGFNPSFAADEYMDFSLSGYDKKGDRIEYTDNVTPGMPWFLRANPLDFIVPWGTHKWEEARWFALRKMRRVTDIMEDPKYKNTSELKGR